MSENCTPAVDAIQTLVGATVGNARPKIMDYGKHCYTVLSPKAKYSLRFVFKWDSTTNFN
jgi:formylmethanofuran dehydrogenase subunit E